MAQLIDKADFEAEEKETLRQAISEREERIGALRESTRRLENQLHYLTHGANSGRGGLEFVPVITIQEGEALEDFLLRVGTETVSAFQKGEASAENRARGEKGVGSLRSERRLQWMKRGWLDQHLQPTSGFLGLLMLSAYREEDMRR
jgi:hypothetical protein